MKDNDKQPRRAERREQPEAPQPGAAPPPEAPASEALVEPAEQAVARLQAELTGLKDRYLRLAAEYDNFRKRALKERSELWARAQADVLQRLVDALDDLARFAHVDPEKTDAKTIHEGVDMVERKFWKQLEAIGVTRVDQVGVPFDPNLHEAVTMRRADHPAKDHTVGAVLQPGYLLGRQLLRPARVEVLAWQDAPSERGEGWGGGGDDDAQAPGDETG